MSKLFLLPLALGILFPIIFLITYGIAVGNGHIPATFSYISDTGTIPPEMCIFGQLLHLVCILYFCVIYVRYRQVAEYYQWKYQRKCTVNKVAYVMGILAVFGASMVANFQETSQFIVHVLGSILAFLLSSVWCIIHGYLSLKMLPDYSNKPIAYVRIMLGVLSVITFIIAECTGIVSLGRFKSHHGEDAQIEHTVQKTLSWTSSHPAWDLRGVSVVCEWLLLTLFDIYILTFTPEFRKLDYQCPRVLINVNEVGDEKEEVIRKSSLLGPIPNERDESSNMKPDANETV